MKMIKNYLSIRRYRTIIPSLCLLFIYAFTANSSVAYTTENISYITFEEERAVHLCMWFLVITALILLLNLVVMIRDYHIAKTRWLLLPQERTTFLKLDTLWMFSILMLMVLSLYFFYQHGFYVFLDMIKEQDIFHYAQTKVLSTSLQRVPLTAFLFPMKLVLMLRSLIFLFSVAIFVPILATFFLFEKSMTRKQFIGYLMAMPLTYAMVCYVPVLFSLGWMCFTIYLVGKRACICWSAS